MNHDDNLRSIVFYLGDSHNEALSGREIDVFSDTSVLWNDC